MQNLDITEIKHAMKKFNLGQIEDQYIDKVGGKARGLDRLIKEGFCVPKGFVLFDIELDTDLEEATAFFEDSRLTRVAVRSSATAEDGEDCSYAGQFVTVLNVEGRLAFQDALKQCIGSLKTKLTDTYSKNFANSQKSGMTVVVQQMLVPECAGVCFTANPQDSNQIIVEAVDGLGEQLVSGEKSAVQYIEQIDTFHDFICDNSSKKIAPPLTKELLCQIYIQGLEIQSIMGVPQDLEWAVYNGKLFWLQARPITTLDSVLETEFNFDKDIIGHATTKFNIGEMLPGAVTPLSLTTTVYAIDWGIRRMLNIIGANKKMREIPDFGCVFSSYGHLFMNLTQLYRVANTTFLAGKKNIDFSICDRELVGDENGIIAGKKKWFIPRLYYSFRYIAFIMSYKKAIKQIDRLAKKFIITHDNTPQGLYNAIDKSLVDVNIAALLHYVTSGHGGAMSSAVTNALNKKLKCTEKSRSVLAQMLERIDGIESADILHSLSKVADTVLLEEPKAKNFSVEQLQDYLQLVNSKVKEAIATFMKRHGHRAVREAELRNKSWANDEVAFVKYLKTVINGTLPSAENASVPNLKAIAKENGFKGMQAGKIVYFAKQARAGVVNREFSKAKLIKVFDVLKSAYGSLATKLVEIERIPDEDIIYFLTHKEVGQLVKTQNPKLIKKALQRRRIIKQQATLTFKEVYVGIPVPYIIDYSASENKNILQGTPVSRGIVTGTARVVQSIEDAEKLQKGEIMVAEFTDIGWSPFYCLIDGLVTEVGSALSHGAVVAREYALPLVAGVAGATKLIQTGDIITIDGNAGIVLRRE